MGVDAQAISGAPNVSLDDVKKAHRRIQPYIHRTPVLTCEALDKMASSEKVKVKLFMKCENFQKVGAFKIRGATNAILSLSSNSASTDVTLPPNLTVITHSSGNHAQALSYAARALSIACEVIMPTTAPLVKQSAVKAYGARITFCAPTLAAREETMTKRKEELEKEERKVEVIPPYDDLRVVAGQGTLVLEMVGQVADIAREKGLGTGKSKLDLDVVVAPVGGGGLLSGTAVAAKGLNPGILVVGAEPKNADDAKRSFDTGVWQPALDPVTVADGLKTSTGHITFPLIQQYADTICTVHETEIIQAMKLVYERMKLVIEPSAAVPLAVILYSQEFRQHIERLAERKRKGSSESDDATTPLNIGLVFSGGNVDLAMLGELFSSVR